jgi:ribosome-binding protein aMBF1 (putative translation factor)
MANSRVLNFPQKKTSTKKAKAGAKEKLSQELLRELTKDEAYREFASAEAVYKEIGASLSRIRKAKKLSVADLARKVGKSEKVILRMERGEYKQYTQKLLLQLASVLNAKLKISFD